MSQVEYTAQDFELVGIKEDQTDVLSQKTTNRSGYGFIQDSDVSFVESLLV